MKSDKARSFWTKCVAFVLFFLANAAMAGKPVYHHKRTHAEAICLGNSYLAWTPQVNGTADSAYWPAAFYTTSQAAPGARLTGTPAGEIVYVLLEKKTNIAAGAMGRLDFVESTAPGWGAFAFEKFSDRTQVSRKVLNKLLNTPSRNAVYAAMVLEKNGVALGDITGTDLMTRSLKAHILSEEDYAWLLYILDQKDLLKTWAQNSELGSACFLLYLLSHGEPVAAAAYLQAHREPLRETLAGLHNNRSFSVYAPVKAKTLDETTRQYKEQGNPVVDLDLTILVDIELALQTGDSTKARSLVKQAFSHDKNVLDAVTMSGHAQLMPWTADTPLLFARFGLVPDMTPNAIVQMQKYGEYLKRLADNSSRTLLDLRVFLSMSPDAVEFSEAWDVLTKRFYGTNAENNIELLEIALRTGHAPEGAALGLRMEKERSVKDLKPGYQQAARFFLLLGQLELLAHDSAAFDARMASPEKFLETPYHLSPRTILSPTDERMRCVLLAARAWYGGGNTKAAAAKLLLIPDHAKTMADWRKLLEGKTTDEQFTTVTLGIFWALPALTRMPEFVRFFVRYVTAQR